MLIINAAKNRKRQTKDFSVPQLEGKRINKIETANLFNYTTAGLQL